MRPVFAFWTGDDSTVLSSFQREWSNAFSEFRIFGDADILPLVDRYFPQHIIFYTALRIPAAKADIARLLMLFETGGLYVDCHCGLRNAPEVVRLLESTRHGIEAIFIDRILSQKARPPEQHFLLNSIMFAAPRSPLIFMCLRQAFANLSAQYHREHEQGFAPYHIGALTGPTLMTSVVLEPGSSDRDVRQGFVDRVQIIREEVAPVVRGRHRTYGTPGSHWSVRQRSEPLFER